MSESHWVYCPASGVLPYREDSRGWPHGRQECIDCHGFVQINRDGSIRRHRPWRGDHVHEAAKRAGLYSGE